MLTFNTIQNEEIFLQIFENQDEEKKFNFLKFEIEELHGEKTFLRKLSIYPTMSSPQVKIFKNKF